MNKTTVILVHGWLGNGVNPMNRLLTEGTNELRYIYFKLQLLLHFKHINRM